MSSVLYGVDINAQRDITYTKVKVNPNGRKSVGILNKTAKSGLLIQTPLMKTWGVNEYQDDKGGSSSYDFVLQYPIDELNNPDCVEFLKNMQTLEQKIKDDAIENCKEWLNKSKASPDAIDALWTPMLKYPKDKDTGEPDYSRKPTLKIKIPYWEDSFNVELYDEKEQSIFPNDNGISISELITKGSHIATLIQCGGIWVANGKFGVTWRLVQAVVKPRESLRGKCHIKLSSSEKEKMETTSADTEESHETIKEENPTMVEDSDDEDDVRQEVKQEIESKGVVTEDVPKKKKVVKKKGSV